MISPGSLVIFRNQLARVSSCAEGRISIDLESGETKKVREKDVSLLYAGLLSKIPADIGGGDFDTAHAMLVSDHSGRDPVSTTWKELAELVFGTYDASTAAACARRAAKGDLFEISEEGPRAISLEEIERARRKADEKLQESARRASFAAALRKAMKEKAGGEALRSVQEYARYLADLEAFALGQGERCPIAQEAGIAETRDAAYQALLDSGLWEKAYNPWPARSGCVLRPPRLEFPSSELESAFPERADMRRLAAYAIDNAWSTDPDDAVSYDGGRVWVHIADPAAFIAPDSAVDAEALSRGSTLYLPEKIIPMLPEGAVERLGLGLADASPALSFGMRLSADGSPEDTVITPSLVSVSRLDYEGADALLASGDAVLAGLDAVAKLRHARRLANGAVDIDLPEVSMKVEGDEPRFVPVPPTRSSEIVREMMLLAGEAVARWAYERRLPFTYSSQEAPQLPKTASRSDSEEKLLSVQYQRRRGMKASIVGTECLAHQGLGLSFYSQVTSPLRRYQDLLAHYQIRGRLAAESQGRAAGSNGASAKGASRTLSSDEVSRRCMLAGQASSATRQAERDSRAHWIAYYLLKHPEWKGAATVLEVRDQDLWLIIPEFGLETALRTRRGAAVDETVEIRAARVALALNDITFELV